jgi:hypothetical protein
MPTNPSRKLKSRTSGRLPLSMLTPNDGFVITLVAHQPISGSRRLAEGNCQHQANGDHEQD